MPIYASSEGTTPRELVPEGTHIARCYQIVDLGTQQDEWKGQVKQVRKVRIGWELPDELRVFNEGEPEAPMIIGKEYALSLGEKSNLRAMLTSWRGKAFTEEEAKKFDVTNLLGVPCQITIVHETSKSDPSKKYAKISSVTTLGKRTQAPPPMMDKVLFEFDNPNMDVFNKLPGFIQETIKKAAEWANIAVAAEQSMANPHAEPVSAQQAAAQQQTPPQRLQPPAQPMANTLNNGSFAPIDDDDSLQLPF